MNGDYSDGNNVELAPKAKKPKKVKKQSKTTVKWEKKHRKIRAASSCNQDKYVQVHLLQEQNDLVNTAMWSSFLTLYNY